MKRWLAGCSALALAGTLLSTSLVAQTITTGSLNVKVTNAEGAPVAGARVTAVHRPSGTSYTATTMASGRAAIPAMRVGGPYQISVAAIGYESQTRSDIHIVLGVAEEEEFRLAPQVVTLEETERRPALAFAYYVKLPSASEVKGLGSGRVDHRVVGLLSRKFGETDVDLNLSYLNAGREDSDRRASGGQAALAFSREFENDFGVEAEISGQSLDDVQPHGVFALGALTYKVGPRVRLDGGVRFGLNPEAPRVGVFAGVSVGAADLFRR